MRSPVHLFDRRHDDAVGHHDAAPSHVVVQSLQRGGNSTCRRQDAAGSPPTKMDRPGESHLDLLQDVNALGQPSLLVGFHCGMLHACAIPLGHLRKKKNDGRTFEPRELSLRGVAAFGLHLLDVGDLLLAAAGSRAGDGTLREHVLFDMLLELVERSSAAVGLGIIFPATVHPVLDRRVTGDAVLVAETLLSDAVDVRDEDVGMVRILRRERVPRRFHALAMAAPWSEELDERVLSALKDLPETPTT
mmetsp:Transcript_9272/g.30130  ORF Transcript_9272/g.30130 Transcript_9272/m.30130 type:complete len:247 (+) Transcript_9272:218-958(+)